MRLFRCDCGSQIFFDNTRCLSCDSELGFLPDVLVLATLAPTASAECTTRSGVYRKCSNYAHEGVCNWMVPADSDEELCEACRLNAVIPDLSQADNRRLWAEVEKAKRRLVYTLKRMGLGIVSKRDDAETGLSFHIKADEGEHRVLTGHNDGLITLNLAEADPAQRERIRMDMKERYRTLLGHFRHEIGHYYWDRLVRDTPRLAQFRELFGDETEDYSQALARHYSEPPPTDFAETLISPYAAAHPWEDFAETFAHYLHMRDTLETAQQFGFVSEPLQRTSLSAVSDFDALMSEWIVLTIALNALNGSMGLPDAYPFAISSKVGEKLAFVDRLIRDESNWQRDGANQGQVLS